MADLKWTIQMTIGVVHHLHMTKTIIVQSIKISMTTHHMTIQQQILDTVDIQLHHMDIIILHIQHRLMDQHDHLTEEYHTVEPLFPQVTL